MQRKNAVVMHCLALSATPRQVADCWIESSQNAPAMDATQSPIAIVGSSRIVVLRLAIVRYVVQQQPVVGAAQVYSRNCLKSRRLAVVRARPTVAANQAYTRALVDVKLEPNQVATATVAKAGRRIPSSRPHLALLLKSPRLFQHRIYMYSHHLRHLHLPALRCQELFPNRYCRSKIVTLTPSWTML